jgi:phenylalanyl-tRNA synthetase beta chain
VRPFVVGAVLRNITFTQSNYESFIDLQDKLHHNICRKRTLVAIGTHDLDTLTPPFRYDARRPTDLRFRPLNQPSEVNGAELMELYSKDSHLKAFLPIIKDKEFYPIIFDSKDTVLSLPPIINGDHSKITLNTRNVFIECTATDLRKAEIVLDTMVTMFAEYCEKPFHVEAIQVTQLDGSKHVYPKLSERFELVNAGEINKKIGINIDAGRMCLLLNKMGLRSEIVAQEQGTIRVKIPPTRSDILHACDIVEDVAIGYGYNNIAKTIPATNCFSTEVQ